MERSSSGAAGVEELQMWKGCSPSPILHSVNCGNHIWLIPEQSGWSLNNLVDPWIIWLVPEQSGWSLIWLIPEQSTAPCLEQNCLWQLVHMADSNGQVWLQGFKNMKVIATSKGHFWCLREKLSIFPKGYSCIFYHYNSWLLLIGRIRCKVLLTIFSPSCQASVTAIAFLCTCEVLQSDLKLVRKSLRTQDVLIFIFPKKKTAVGRIRGFVCEFC